MNGINRHSPFAVISVILIFLLASACFEQSSPVHQSSTGSNLGGTATPAPTPTQIPINFPTPAPLPELTPTPTPVPTTVPIVYGNPTLEQIIALNSEYVFDWWFYLFFHPDLVAAGIDSQEAAHRHWIHYGIFEGRRSKADFSVRDYLALNADLSTYFGANNFLGAAVHYAQTGHQEQRKTIQPNSNFSISINDDVWVGNELFNLKSAGRFAGAFSSLRLFGQEIVNNFDPGRLLQTALTYNDQGECNNPTEAGNSRDSGTSSSKLLSRQIRTQGLFTSVQAANWVSQGGSSAYCPSTTVPKLSDTIINKTITIGVGQNPHVVEYLVEVTVPRNYLSMRIEAVTGYHLYQFDRFYQYKFATEELIPTPTVAYENPDWEIDSFFNAALIVTNSNQSLAIGIWATDFSEYFDEQQVLRTVKRVAPRVYGLTALSTGNVNDKTTKWTVGYTHSNVAPGKYRYRMFLAFGNLEQVKSGMRQISQQQRNNSVLMLLDSGTGRGAFEPNFYASKYPDLPAAFGGVHVPRLLRHFFTDGLSNARQAGANFWISSYLQQNPQLAATVGNDNYLEMLRLWLIQSQNGG